MVAERASRGWVVARDEHDGLAEASTLSSAVVTGSVAVQNQTDRSPRRPIR